MLKRVVIFHHPHNESAAELARQFGDELARRGVAAFVADAWEQAAAAHIEQAGMIACIGGDGTVLRAARVAIPHATPILGVNMGRLGFLTDMSPRDLFNHIERIIAEDWRLEERVMVRADVTEGRDAPTIEHQALNDIVVAHRSPGRPIYVDVRIDRARIANYRCDGIIVATPTGSTGYSLSAGGPIMVPTEHHLVLTPISPHLALARAIVLQPESVVELRVTSELGAVLSVDGQDDRPVTSGVHIAIRQSEHITRFVRFRDPSSFFGELAERLDVQLSSAMNAGA